MRVTNEGIDGRRVRGVQGRLTVVCRAAVAVAGLALAIAVQAAPPAVPGMEQIVTRTLSNGMKLVVWPDRSSFTETSKTVAAIDLALATLARLHQDGLSAEQLQSARSYILGQFPPTLETNGQIAARLADMPFHGLGLDDVNEYATRVAHVDAAAARKAIEQSFPRPENHAIVLIGDAARIRAAVGKYGPVTEMKLTDPHFAP